jgi:hypothetical protein
MAREKPAARARRREQAREQARLVRDLEALARLEPGGSAERPLTIASPALVEVLAGAKPCPLCQGPLHVEEHAAITAGGVRLRVAKVACASCGVRRDLYFTLQQDVH